MDTETTPVEKKGISRRAVIASGAAGAAAFWSVPIIDSVTQRAAAGSSPVTLCSEQGMSWAMIFWLDTNVTPNTVYVTGWQGGSCGSFGANPHGSVNTSSCTNGTVGLISGSTGSPGPTDQHFPYSGVVINGNSTSGFATPDTTLGCGYFTDHGSGGITLNNGVTGVELIGGIGWDGHHFFDLCAYPGCSSQLTAS